MNLPPEHLRFEKEIKTVCTEIDILRKLNHVQIV
jgi:hypothetical protein